MPTQHYALFKEQWLKQIKISLQREISNLTPRLAFWDLSDDLQEDKEIQIVQKDCQENQADTYQPEIHAMLFM